MRQKLKATDRAAGTTPTAVARRQAVNSKERSGCVYGEGSGLSPGGVIASPPNHVFQRERPPVEQELRIVADTGQSRRGCCCQQGGPWSWSVDGVAPRL